MASLVDITQTGGGAACAFGAGVAHGITERGLDEYLGRSRAYSGGLLNETVRVVGKTDELLGIYKSVLPSLIDKRVCAADYIHLPAQLKKLFGVPTNRETVDLTVLHTAIDDILTADTRERLKAHKHPLYALAVELRADGTKGPIEYLDVREHGVPALKATSCITSCVAINGKAYTDPGFHQPFEYNKWNNGESMTPEILVINRGKPHRSGNLEAHFFFSVYDIQLPREQATKEHAALKRLYELQREGKPLLRLRAKTPIAFSTTNTSLIEDAYEEGYCAAARVEEFIEQIASHQAAGRAA